MGDFLVKALKEYNLVRKNHRKVDLKFALCYPSTYSVGMSSLGFRLIYTLINIRENVACERVFYVPEERPRSVESGLELSEFDVVGFSLQYEEDYVNLVKMLLSSGIPVWRSERDEKNPLIVAGGVCAIENPMPLSDFIDVFLIGDGEALIEQLIDICVEERGKHARMEALSKIDGFYVPGLNDGKVKRVWCKSIEDIFCPTMQVIPVKEEKGLTPVFGRSFLLEIARGCERGCRFCLIGFCGRPRRIRSERRLRQLMEEGIKQSGVRKVTLIAPSISGLKIVDLCWEAVNAGLEISLPSLSIDAVTDDLLDAIVEGGQRTVTIAPEAGTENMRIKINKPFSDEEIIATAEKIEERGLSLKAYFIIGLPYEKEEDVDAIAKLIDRISKSGGRKLKVSVNPFVPKPHTPFSWVPQNSLQTLRYKRARIQKLLRGKRINLEGMDLRKAFIEAFLSLGGSEISRIIELAARYGGGLGGWRRAFKESKFKAEHIYKFRSPDEEQPWEIVDVGVNKQFLIKEWERAIDGVQTPPYSHCKECMICDY